MSILNFKNLNYRTVFLIFIALAVLIVSLVVVYSQGDPSTPQAVPGSEFQV